MDLTKAAGRSSQSAALPVNASRAAASTSRPPGPSLPSGRSGHGAAQAAPDHRPPATLQRSSELDDRCAPAAGVVTTSALIVGRECGFGCLQDRMASQAQSRPRLP
jgi:hypothetical protein